MVEEYWDSLSREVVSLFLALTEHTPLYMICLDWNMVSTDFEDKNGSTNWTDIGDGLSQFVETNTIEFLIFSKVGLHKLTYRMDKRPEIKHILNISELGKFKIIKSRQDRIEIQIEREKDILLGRMKFLDTYNVDFNPEQWDYLQLRRKIISGKKIIEQFSKPGKVVKKTKSKPKQTKPMISIPRPALDLLRSKLEIPHKKDIEEITDEYDESIKNAELDIKSMKNRDNQKSATTALNKMQKAAKVIKRCDKDVHKRNIRLHKLRRERIEIRKKPMRKLVKQARLDEIDRKIKMINRLNEKELMIKTQNVTDFCGLREAILTIRINESKLKPHDIDLLIQDVISIDSGDEQSDKVKKIINRNQKDQQQMVNITILVESGTKEQWKKYFRYHLKNNLKVKLPPLDSEKCKFDDYGYRQLIELMIESPDFLRKIIEIKDVFDFNVVELNDLIRGDNSTLRGLETLCSLIINHEARYDPVSETDFKYLEIILNSIVSQEKDGIDKKWEIYTENAELTITATFDKDNRVWIYQIQ